MKKSISTSLTLTVILLSAVLLTACKTVQTTANSTTNHATAQLQRDSIYLHDSIFVRIRADTVYLEKWHTRWREKEIIHTDTVHINTIQVQTKEVRYVPRFYKYCAVLTVLLLILLLLRVTLYLYRRFH